METTYQIEEKYPHLDKSIKDLMLARLKELIGEDPIESKLVLGPDNFAYLIPVQEIKDPNYIRTFREEFN